MKRLIMALLALGLAACEKEIEIDLNTADPQIVIEGAITDQPGPYSVKISQTVNFSELSYPAVTDAEVIIYDSDDVVDTLREIAPGRYQTNSIRGQVGHSYHLSVEVNGRKFSATSTMPDRVPLDSLRFEPFSHPAFTDGYATVPVFRDPDTKANYYRFLQTINGRPDPAYIVFNDNINNGLVNERPIFSEDAEIHLGDSVLIEMRCIDADTYAYFFTLSQISGGGPGGGTTPSNPPNNIVGENAVGLFSAYTIQKLTREVR